MTARTIAFGGLVSVVLTGGGIYAGTKLHDIRASKAAGAITPPIPTPTPTQTFTTEVETRAFERWEKKQQASALSLFPTHYSDADKLRRVRLLGTTSPRFVVEPLVFSSHQKFIEVCLAARQQVNFEAWQLERKSTDQGHGQKDIFKPDYVLELLELLAGSETFYTEVACSNNVEIVSGKTPLIRLNHAKGNAVGTVVFDVDHIAGFEVQRWIPIFGALGCAILFATLIECCKSAGSR